MDNFGNTRVDSLIPKAVYELARSVVDALCIHTISCALYDSPTVVVLTVVGRRGMYVYSTCELLVSELLEVRTIKLGRTSLAFLL